MARGDSGRIVVEIDPEFKREFYAVLTTFKDWLLTHARSYVEEHEQPRLFSEPKTGVSKAAALRSNE